MASYSNVVVITKIMVVVQTKKNRELVHFSMCKLLLATVATPRKKQFDRDQNDADRVSSFDVMLPMVSISTTALLLYN